MEEVHPKTLFGDDWVEYLARIEKAETKEELLDILLDIFKKHKISIGDSAFVFAKVLFSEKTFQEMTIEREYFLTMRLFERLQKEKQRSK